MEVEHDIQLLPNSPFPNTWLCRKFVLEENKVKKKLQQLIEQGFIQPTTSPCRSHIIIVPKKHAIWLICIDYRQLNKNILNNSYSFPRIDDLFDQFNQEKYLTKMDLKLGYHQVQVREEDI